MSLWDRGETLSNTNKSQSVSPKTEIDALKGKSDYTAGGLVRISKWGIYPCWFGNRRVIETAKADVFT